MIRAIPGQGGHSFAGDARTDAKRTKSTAPNQPVLRSEVIEKDN